MDYIASTRKVNLPILILIRGDIKIAMYYHEFGGHIIKNLDCYILVFYNCFACVFNVANSREYGNKRQDWLGFFLWEKDIM
mmetsp:Transcript_22774/g.52181  ORF Transcript_22774/g.52181 Transcript_22774/m.52181 type:complete len:81 (+) Transcript_22774:4898-5140(+)